MKKALYLLMLIISFMAGYLVASMKFNEEQTFLSEKRIGKEVALLEKYNESAPCERLVNQQQNMVVVQYDNAIIIWKIDKDNTYLKKLIVDAEYQIAEERIIDNCF